MLYSDIRKTSFPKDALLVTIMESNGAMTSSTSVRSVMKEYWTQFQASEESMMLCSAANDSLAEEDRAQILRVCPSVAGKRVLELGAGIG